MADKDRALELARAYSPSEFKMRPIGDIYKDARQAIADKYNAFIGNPIVQAFGEEPLEMTKAVGEAGWEGAKQLPGMAADAAKWAYENPSKAAGHAVEFAAGMSPNPVAMFLWGPGGFLSPTEAGAPEIDPQSAAAEHSRQQIMNQEAQMMRDENYAGGYCGGGEVRQAHGNGRKVVSPLAAAAESAMTKAAEKVLAEKAAKAAEYIPHDDPRRAANLLAYRGNTPQEILDQRWYHGTDKDFPSFNADAPIFLTPSPRFANRFSVENVPTGELVEGTGVNPNVMPLIPRAENPFDFENRKHAKALETYLKPEMKNDAYLRYQFDSLKQGDWQEIESKKIQDAIKALGHDSFYVDEYGTKNLAVYSPNQVKSDIGNVGTFDFGTPRLTEAEGGTAYPIRHHTDWEEAHDYEKHGAHMTHMSPDEFLDQVKPLNMDDDDKDIIQHFKEQIEKHTRLDPLAIEKDGHPNGRHRAHAAKELGIKKVPVMTWQGKKGGGTVVKRAIMLVSKKA